MVGRRRFQSVLGMRVNEKKDVLCAEVGMSGRVCLYFDDLECSGRVE
jgi:hypothetical protein